MKRVLVVMLLAGCTEAGSPDAGVSDAGRACERDPIDASASCVKPCDEGNERKVGEFCSKGGGECEDNFEQGAIFCTVDNDDTTDSFCTKPCEQDLQCGANARCSGDPANPTGPKGCVPVQCL